MKIINLFRGNKVDYKKAFEETKGRLEIAAKERDDFNKKINQLGYDNLQLALEVEKKSRKINDLKLNIKELKKEIEKLQSENNVFYINCKKLLKINKELNVNLNNSREMIQELSKEINKRRIKPTLKDIRNYEIKSEKELF